MNEVSAKTLDRLASFRISDGILEVALIQFTTVETGDSWILRVVDYIPDGSQHPTNRMFLYPPTGWEAEKGERDLLQILKP